MTQETATWPSSLPELAVSSVKADPVAMMANPITACAMTISEPTQEAREDDRPLSPKPRPDFSSGPRPLTPQEIESLRRSKQEASKANREFFRKVLGGGEEGKD